MLDISLWRAHFRFSRLDIRTRPFDANLTEEGKFKLHRGISGIDQTKFRLLPFSLVLKLFPLGCQGSMDLYSNLDLFGCRSYLGLYKSKVDKATLQLSM